MLQKLPMALTYLKSGNKYRNLSEEHKKKKREYGKK